MNRRFQRWMKGAVGFTALASQLVLATLVPLADARLEAEAAARFHGSGHSSELHVDHPQHDHHLCDLCRAISLAGLTVPTADVPPSPLPSADLSASVLVGEWIAPSTFLPVGSRAPPAA